MACDQNVLYALTLIPYVFRNVEGIQLWPQLMLI